MTPQEILNKVYFALKKQGKKATTADNKDMCMYRAPDGCKCAAGHLIPDNHYKPSMEQKSICSLVHQLPPFFLENMGLIGDLQQMHDFTWDPYSSEDDYSHLDRLVDRIASFYHLKSPVGVEEVVL